VSFYEVVIKLEVKIRGANSTTRMDIQQFHQMFEDHRNRAQLSSQLKDNGLEIVNAHLDRQIMFVWIWCRSQAALEHIQKLYESNQLRDVVFGSIQPSISVVINVNTNQFKKRVGKFLWLKDITKINQHLEF